MIELKFDLNKSIGKSNLVQVQRLQREAHASQWVRESNVEDTDVVIKPENKSMISKSLGLMKSDIKLVIDPNRSRL